MKHVVCKVAAAALTVQMAAAQPPANIGQWDLAQVSPLSASQGPYGWYAHKPTTTAGCYIMSGGDPNSAVGQNLTAAFQYDPSTQLWSRYPDAPSWQYLASLYSFGGYVFGVSADFSSLAFISSDNYAAAGAGWQVIQMNGAPTTRYHARTSIFGGIMYMFGGSSVPFNISNGQTYNDLWAVDLNDVINSVFVPGRVATGWVQLIANGTAGMPRARAGHVMIPYGHHIWVYGGFEATPNGPFASNHLWRFGPGNNWDAGSLATNNNQYSPAMWNQIPTTGINYPGYTPPSYTRDGVPALIEATASVWGSHLFVFGGFTDAFTMSTDLWVFTFPNQQWFLVPRSGAASWPQIPFGFPFPAGQQIGSHFYLAVPQPNNGGGVVLWRWSFNPFFQPPIPQIDLSTITPSGTVAGLTIACLLNVATLAFVFLQWRKSGGAFSAPSMPSSFPSLSGGLGGGIPAYVPPSEPKMDDSPYAGLNA